MSQDLCRMQFLLLVKDLSGDSRSEQESRSSDISTRRDLGLLDLRPKPFRPPRNLEQVKSLTK